MDFDIKLDIATGLSAKTKRWTNKKTTWSKLVKRLSETTQTNETLKEFLNTSKQEQSRIKDVGGYVGGYLTKGKRSPDHVLHRQILTLDLDFANGEFWEDFIFMYDCAAVIHGTHKHSTEKPRLRLVVPLNRPVNREEYEAIARGLAGSLDIELFDVTTFEVNRLMFWPSTPKDQEYYFEVQDGEILDADQVLGTYTDWTDSTQWPRALASDQQITTAINKQQDPEEKNGIVGAFCRTYSVQDAIDEYLSEIYISISNSRYTYTEGTTAGGLVVYENKFAYSHHGTDPAGGKLCNAFDLVRLHKFGAEDSRSTDITRTKSYKAMEALAVADPKVKKQIAAERLESAKYDFRVDSEELPEQEDLDWLEDLEVDGRGNVKSNANNINTILQNDSYLKQAFKENTFDNKRYLFRSMPWRKIKSPEPVKNCRLFGRA